MLVSAAYSLASDEHEPLIAIKSNALQPLVTKSGVCQEIHNSVHNSLQARNTGAAQVELVFENMALHRCCFPQHQAPVRLFKDTHPQLFLQFKAIVGFTVPTFD